MKFLHTSDWHVGRTVRGQSRLPEHEEALVDVLRIAREEKVDCLIVAGDIFDTGTPSSESERIVFDFLQELYGAGIPAVFIAGNHDHPGRWDALAPLLGRLQIRALGGTPERRADALFEVQSRDGREQGVVAALPWISERAAVRFETLQGEQSAPLEQYSTRVGRALEALTGGFTPESIGVLVAHLFVDNAFVGPGGGERELHINQSIYGVNPSALPVAAQYVALGHVHKNQEIRCGTKAAYSGSLLQLDFGEREQLKYVNLVEVHAKQPATMTPLPIKAGRRLVDIGTPEHGVSLAELATYREQADECWFRVHVDIDVPVANLAELVRAELPSAVDVKRSRGHVDAAPEPETLEHLGPIEMFQRFYESGLGRERTPSPETVDLFRRLLSEEQEEAHADA